MKPVHEKDLRTLSEIAVNLATSINSIVAITTAVPNLELSTLVNTFNTTVLLLNDGLSSSKLPDADQLDLPLVPESTTEDTKSTKDTKIGPEQNKKDKNQKSTLKIVKDPVTKTEEPKKEEAKVEKTDTTSTKDSINASEAYANVQEDGLLVLRKNKGETISPETETAIKASIKAIYGRVHPKHKNSEDVGVDTFYNGALMPRLIETLKKEGINLILGEKKETTKTDTKIVPETKPVVNKEDTTTVPEIKKEEIPTAKVEPIKTEPAKVADQVADILEAEKVNTPVQIEGKKITPEKTNDSPKDEELTLAKPEDVAQAIYEAHYTDNKLKEGVTATAPATIAKTVQDHCKQIFDESFKANKDLTLKLDEKTFTAQSYIYEVLRIVKRLSGGSQESPLVRMGNTPQDKLIKTWIRQEWVKSA